MTDKIKKWMGFREYARHRGISLAAVQDQIKKQLLTVGNNALKETSNGDRKPKVTINVKVADSIWSTMVKSTAQNMHSTQMGGVESAPDSASKSEPERLHGPSYAQSRSIKEAFQAKLAQIDYEKKSGNLCNVDEVNKSAKEMATLTRDYLLNIPGKLAPVLAAETDINEVHRLLEEDIRNALTNLSNGDVF